MSSNQTPKVPPTLYQIVDKSGAAHHAAHTEQLWVSNAQSAVFSAPTAGNKVVAFTTGEAYFADLIKEFDAAASEICIAGWQVNWDALLAPGVRLYDVLLRAAKRGVNIYVMPWNDTEPVQTYDDQTRIVLESINALLPNAKGKPAKVHVALCPAFVEFNGGYYSHHQKQVVVDRKIAYVGGIDLAYGRFDDNTYDLRPDAKGRQGLNRYNPGIPRLLDIKSTQNVDPDLMSGVLDKSNTYDDMGNLILPSKANEEIEKIAKGGWQIPYAEAGGMDIAANSASFSSNSTAPATLDPSRQPRMPWQDIHSRVEGPAVSHLLRNFVGRWNCVSKVKLAAAPKPESYPKTGKALVQVLRSASREHCIKENGSKNARGIQTDIYEAMKGLIAKSRRFIYIENQFFVSDFGEIGGPADALSPAAQYIKDGDSGISNTSLRIVRGLSDSEGEDLDRLPQNGILKSLLQRLREAIVDDVKKPKFHVYITVPVHPEGSLYSPSIAVQVYFTMQTLVFGSHSLINGIRRLIKARELKDKKDPSYRRVIDDPANTEYRSVEIEQCNEYVTLLNLRNWGKVGDKYVTEQIYVHSKLMIVDDRFALFGSANINDRSLLGDRDSELAILVSDEDTKRADINGVGSNQPVRVFAHELRKKIWKKLFGVGLPGREAPRIEKAIDEPGSPASWRAIAKLAASNAAAFEQAFAYIPRNFAAHDQEAFASVLATWNSQMRRRAKTKLVGDLNSPIPFHENFWKNVPQPKDPSSLKSIKGFVSALPVHWTRGENIWIRYPTALIVENQHETDEQKNRAAIAVAATNTPANSDQRQG
ncbi:phospholipase D-like domain-containing protein [Massilia eburnea]|uniref:phospholipase D-like domain-containing protein n=1 Tax=Massilia eburnea TaxID=1776165 RepID=UPI003D6BE9C7